MSVDLEINEGALGQGAFERYLQQFTPEVTTRQIERCFETTIEVHRSRGPIALARAK